MFSECNIIILFLYITLAKKYGVHFPLSYNEIIINANIVALIVVEEHQVLFLKYCIYSKCRYEDSPAEYTNIQIKNLLDKNSVVVKQHSEAK